MEAIETITNFDILEPEKSNHGGLRAGAGRPKGATNRIPRVAKENIIQVFDQLGGVDGMVAWATKDDKNKGEFYKIYARLLPIESNISGIDGDAIDINVIEYVIKRPECLTKN